MRIELEMVQLEEMAGNICIYRETVWKGDRWRGCEVLRLCVGT